MLVLVIDCSESNMEEPGVSQGEIKTMLTFLPSEALPVSLPGSVRDAGKAP